MLQGSSTRQAEENRNLRHHGTNTQDASEQTRNQQHTPAPITTLGGAEHRNEKVNQSFQKAETL